jgi:1-deoxy-D-xylulose-5-phosphate reductoisomerase
MKRIAILGSTGSIGVQSLDVITEFPDQFSVHSLTANTQIERLKKQIAEFKPRMVAVKDEENAKDLPSYQGELTVHTGIDGLVDVVTHPDVDLVISAIPGSAGFIPTLRAIEAGKSVALANKELLVMAGEIIMNAARKSGVDIIPLDSEHIAIHQCLAGQNLDDVQRLILTASGGPFLHSNREHMEKMSPAEALDHPTWNMGQKITIDSATLMNKGFEVIEAHWLFGIPVSKIDVVIHPQSIIHSMVEMIDGNVLAQIGPPDMRIPIQYALTYPKRLDTPWPRFDITRAWDLSLLPPDHEKFPCLGLAYEAGRIGTTLPAVLSTADEMAVDAFLNGQIGFMQIPKVIADAMSCHAKNEPMLNRHSALSLNAVLEADSWARTYCRERFSAV